ncbi:MAG: hypothetical protein V4564_21000 [Pseudomonadota bacterium]|uniref:hypothetical protein n=1 Tax=Sphingomonas sp. ERG5 TaxID=1381597 RepID=UPI000AD69CE5|nr:hypothetical protein [Sphingomonas sp. ERG5]
MLWNRAKCLVGKHERAGRLAHFDGEIFVSQCKNCGTAMAKDFERGWIAVDASHGAKGDPTNKALFLPADAGMGAARDK